jgi:transcriptional regulator with XRE-family HTH domain
LSAGLTLEQTAERGDLDLKHLQKYEAGHINVTLVRVAKGLKVDLADLFTAPSSASPATVKRTQPKKAGLK